MVDVDGMSDQDLAALSRGLAKLQNGQLQKGNALEQRFKALTYGVGYPDLYMEQARKAGLRFGPETRLSPHIMTATTPISLTEPAPLTGVPVSLSANTPRATLRYYFQDAAFIRRMTSVVTACRATADGQPDQFFADSVNVRDLIYCQVRRDGSGDVLSNDFITLSSCSGIGMDTYFWNLVPVIDRSGSLLIDLTIIPPGNTQLVTPPFLDWVGMIQIDLHTERFEPFSV